MNVDCIFETTLAGIEYLKENFTVLDVIDANQLSLVDLYMLLEKNYKNKYSSAERIVLVVTEDFYRDISSGIVLHSIQNMLNNIDISNFFVCIVTTNSNIEKEYQYLLENISIDKVPLNFFICKGTFRQSIATTQSVFTKYQSIKHKLNQTVELTEKNKNRLFNSKTFCMAPWVGFSIGTNGQVKTCAHSQDIVGNCNVQSLSEIWNSNGMKSLRTNMLANQEISSCKHCYKNEKLGITSLRNLYNNSFVKRMYKVAATKINGELDDFSLNFIDARFNNICNLVCRTCGNQSSSAWHRPAVILQRINESTPALLVAGRSKSDLIDQIIDSADHLDQIYFCGGEPMLIEEFYHLLDVLDSKARHDVELLYNTNLTRMSLKDRCIFNSWEKFSNISIGASLDGEYERGEYIRIGTKWDDVLTNRQKILNQRPDIHFYVFSTVSILNVLHLPDFHKSWVKQGLITPEQFDVNILFEPTYFGIDSAPNFLKDQIRKKYQEHIEWLQPKDSLGRATQGFQSVLLHIKNKKSFDKDNFWKEIHALDSMYKLNFDNVFPELRDLPK
jgi:radical SAM protein with 4Fe4S-binding SPASM domain